MKNLASLALALALAVAPAIVTAQPDATAAARMAAADWLNKLDAADYVATWDSAATVFKSAISVQSWQQSVQSVLQPLGALQSRTDRSATFTRSLPGAADGQYVVLQYQATYAHKQQAIETITAKQETEGTWKVAGYFLK